MTRNKTKETGTALSGDVLDAMPAEKPMVAVSETGQVMAMIERIMLDPNADIDKLERLMAMKDRLDAQRAAREYAVAMSAAQAEMPAIQKNRKNDQTNSYYAELEVINDAIVPIYTKHGLSLSFDTIPASKPEWVAVRCRVRHVGGHVEESTYETPYDNTGIAGKVNKTTTHGLSSGVTYARRYITMLVFNLTIKGDDKDGNANKIKSTAISEKQALTLQEWIDESKADKIAFLEYFGVENLVDLPASRYQEALSGLKQKAKQK